MTNKKFKRIYLVTYGQAIFLWVNCILVISDWCLEQFQRQGVQSFVMDGKVT